PPAPPSFPTRRSSDLPCRELLGIRHHAQHVVDVNLARFERVLPVGSTAAIRPAVEHEAVAVLDLMLDQRLRHCRLAVAHAAEHRDRKSTRLNSSHVKI